MPRSPLRPSKEEISLISGSTDVEESDIEADEAPIEPPQTPAKSRVSVTICCKQFAAAELSLLYPACVSRVVAHSAAAKY